VRGTMGELEMRDRKARYGGRKLRRANSRCESAVYFQIRYGAKIQSITL
jgi:hypothetical protein